MTLGLAATAERTAAGSSTRWHSVLIVSSFVLVLFALGNLADVLGADETIQSSGTVVWVGLLLVALMGWFSVQFDSGIATLIAAVTLVAVVVSFVDWVFEPEGSSTFRWILLATALGLAAAAVRGPQRGEHHAVGLVSAAGVALLTIAFTFAVDALGALFGAEADIEANAGWELVLLAGGVALLAYSAYRRQSGPGYLGVLNLGAFVLLASTVTGGDDASLIGWPIVMVLAAVALLALGMRPSGAGLGSGAGPGSAPSPVAEGAPPAS